MIHNSNFPNSPHHRHIRVNVHVTAQAHQMLDPFVRLHNPQLVEINQISHFSEEICTKRKFTTDDWSCLHLVSDGS